MGPVISAQHRETVLGYIEKGVARGGEAALRTAAARNVPDRDGFFVGPTVFDDVSPDDDDRPRGDLRARWPRSRPSKALDEAIAVMHAHPNANATSIFTSSGKAAREFAHRATASMVGVNIGVAAPMAYFPFGGAARQLLRRPEGPRPRRVRVLHRQESCHLKMVLGTSRCHPERSEGSTPAGLRRGRSSGLRPSE